MKNEKKFSDGIKDAVSMSNFPAVNRSHKTQINSRKLKDVLKGFLKTVETNNKGYDI